MAIQEQVCPVLIEVGFVSYVPSRNVVAFMIVAVANTRALVESNAVAFTTRHVLGKAIGKVIVPARACPHWIINPPGSF